MSVMTAEEQILAASQARAAPLVPVATIDPKKANLKHKDHVAWIRGFGRGLAFPLMLSLSAGALITLSGSALTIVISAFFTRVVTAETINTGIILLIVGLLVVGMDVLEVVMSYDVMKQAEQGISWKSYWGTLFFIMFIGGVESLTYGVLLARLEHPSALDHLAWLLIILRCVATPIVAVKLATLGESIMTPREMYHQLDVMTTNALAGTLTMINMHPSVENLPILLGFKRWLRQAKSDDVNAEMLKRQEDLDDGLIGYVNEILPGAVAAKAQGLVNAAERRASDAEARLTEMELRMKDQLHDAEDRVADTVTTLLKEAFLGLAFKGKLPAIVLDLAPELEDLDLTNLNAAGGKKQSARAVTPDPKDELARVFAPLGVDLSAIKKVYHPASKDGAKREDRDVGTFKQGPWITTADLQVIAGDMSREDANKIATFHGDKWKFGTLYVLPLKKALRVLAGRNNQFHADIKEWAMTYLAKKSDTTDAVEDDDVQ